MLELSIAYIFCFSLSEDTADYLQVNTTPHPWQAIAQRFCSIGIVQAPNDL